MVVEFSLLSVKFLKVFAGASGKRRKLAVRLAHRAKAYGALLPWTPLNSGASLAKEGRPRTKAAEDTDLRQKKPALPAVRGARQVADGATRAVLPDSCF